MKSENFRVQQIDDTFYVQQKTVFGWMCVKDKLFDNPPATLLLAVTILVTISFIFVKPPIFVFLIPFTTFILGNIAYFTSKKSFYSLESAKSYINETINKSNEVKTSKYYYLSLKNERKNKLKNLM